MRDLGWVLKVGRIKGCVERKREIVGLQELERTNGISVLSAALATVGVSKANHLRKSSWAVA